ncbi:MAG: prepilin-type N-terminal cleavage/methylation domain-containing protein [Patescibacteria group bacterium]|jgi:type II secretion system protein G
MTFKRTQTDQTQGFTLIELLIVIAIIGLLATLAIVSLTTAQRKARDTKRLADVKQIQNAVEIYYRENNTYPLTDDVNNTTWTEFGTSLDPYTTALPIDPTNTSPYVYTYGTNAAGIEYFVAVELEQTDHNALNGDDDNAYAVADAGWEAPVSFISSDGNSAVALDCVDPMYCLSD